MLIVCPACQQHALVDSARSEQDCAHCGSSIGGRILQAALLGVVAVTTAACYGGPAVQMRGPQPPPLSSEPTPDPSAAPSGPVTPILPG